MFKWLINAINRFFYKKKYYSFWNIRQSEPGPPTGIWMGVSPEILKACPHGFEDWSDCPDCGH